jgi:hypothetical protein
MLPAHLYFFPSPLSTLSMTSLWSMVTSYFCPWSALPSSACHETAGDGTEEIGGKSKMAARPDITRRGDVGVGVKADMSEKLFDPGLYRWNTS